jgi:tetratricopeptide (TPR) repeat protein
MSLFDSDNLAEAADCFEKMAAADSDSRYLGAAFGGAVEDLRGNRARALELYKKALSEDQGGSYRYSNFGTEINRAWLEARLKTPYSRQSELSLPEPITADALISMVNKLGWTHEGRNPRLIYEKAAGMDIPRTHFWLKLGMVLLDSGDLEEALAAFVKSAAASDASKLYQFAAWAWQGHLNDLLGRREAALAAYRMALEFDTGETMTHSQFRMKIDRAWVEARIRAPFLWKKTARSSI